MLSLQTILATFSNPIKGNNDGPQYGGILSCDVVFDTCYQQGGNTELLQGHYIQVVYMEGVLEHVSPGTTLLKSPNTTGDDAFHVLKDIFSRVGGYLSIQTKKTLGE